MRSQAAGSSPVGGVFPPGPELFPALRSATTKDSTRRRRPVQDRQLSRTPPLDTAYVARRRLLSGRLRLLADRRSVGANVCKGKSGAGGAWERRPRPGAPRARAEPGAPCRRAAAGRAPSPRRVRARVSRPGPVRRSNNATNREHPPPLVHISIPQMLISPNRQRHAGFAAKFERGPRRALLESGRRAVTAGGRKRRPPEHEERAAAARATRPSDHPLHTQTCSNAQTLPAYGRMAV